MERSERPPPRHRRNSTSFSSSLLDAIYRSIDESDSGGGNLIARAPNPTPKKTRAVSERPMTRPHYLSTSASSDSSSYFSSSSDADSARIVRPKPVRTAPVLPRSDPPLPPNPKKNPISIKKKLRDLKKSTSPSSPGAKLAGFLNSLFTASSHKKPKISAPSPAEDPSSICSSASSYSRSCLSKTPSTSESAGGRRSARSVRFCPVGVIVGEDCRPCGEKVLFDGDMAAAVERRKRMVEELLKGFEMEEDESGDESEDLFELENLAGIGGGGRLRDELPVYETTDLEMNCAIARGLIV